MKALRNTFLAVATATLMISCKKDNTNSGVLYQVKTANRTVSLARMMSGTLQWTSGYAWAKEIEFEAENDNGVDVEYKTETRQKVDLFAPLSTLNTIQVPQGTYDEIKFEVEVAPNNNEAAFLLNGSYTSNSVTTPVVFRIDLPLEMETEKDNYTIASGNNYTAVTTFDLSLLTQGITAAMLDAATRTSGTVIISATSNTNLYNIMFDRLRNCGGIEIDD